MNRALQAAHPNRTMTTFGGVNVIAFGDFHQLPPIGDDKLYHLRNKWAPNSEHYLGYHAFQQFKKTVVLTEQCRIQDAEWQALLGRMRYGICTKSDILELRRLVIKASDSCKHQDKAITLNPFEEYRSRKLHWRGMERCGAPHTASNSARSLECNPSGQLVETLRSTNLAMSRIPPLQQTTGDELRDRQPRVQTKS